MQCPLCGREVAELAAGLCAQCVSERKPFWDAPEVVDAVRCAHCGRLERGGGWIRVEGDVEALAREALRHEVTIDPALENAQLGVAMAWEDERNSRAELTLTGSYQSHPVHRTAPSRVRVKTGACQDCSRRFGGYFEAILQIRAGDERVLQLEADRLLGRLNREVAAQREQQREGAYVSKSERVRGGMDLYMGNLEVARIVAHRVADAYGAEYAESSKLVGRRDGRDLLRFTILVRLPPYLPGDFVQLDNGLFRVLRVDRKLLTLWDLERRERVQRQPRRVERLKLVGTPQDVRDAVVVSHRNGLAQLLDPWSLKTVDLNVPENLAGRETVPVFRHEETLYVLPTVDA